MVHALRAQEEALRESEGRFRALLDQSSVGFFLCDARLRITHCNEYLSCLINIPLQEIIGADLSNLRNGRLRPYIAAASRGEATFYEGPFRSRNGGSLYALIQYVPLRNEAGEVTGGIGAFADISFRVLGERQLRAQKVEMERINIALHDRTLELEAAMRARSRLYSSMNHELRTPISAILLYQELLIAGSLGPLNEEQLSAIEHSHRATRHLLDLVRDILDLGRIEAGRIKVKPVTVKLVPLLDELQASLSPLAESFGSSLYLELAPDLEPVVTDPKRLRQILMNLVSNAAKFGRRNPIRMRGLRRTNGDTVVEVIDRGIGIPPEEIDRIFEEFVQLSLSDETEQGTGLGLAICRRLADLLGGRVEVESTVDVGSVFRVVLPAVTPSAAPAAGVPVVGVPLV
jgi:PAS domain S-box-containing protein